MSLQELFRDDFPVSQRLMSAQFSISPGPAGVVAQSTGSGALAKVQFSKADRSRVLQVGPDGITYHIVGRYQSWETHFEEFQGHYRTLLSRYVPNTLLGLDVRFINKIDTPFDSDSKDYLKDVPMIPAVLGETFNAFLYRLSVTPSKGIDANLIIANEPVTEDGCAYVFDISVSCNDSALIDGSTELASIFSALRLEKNKIFEAFITDKSRNMFNNQKANSL